MLPDAQNELCFFSCDITDKSQAPSCSHPPFRCLCTSVRSPQRPLFFWLERSSSLCRSLHEEVSQPLNQFSGPSRVPLSLLTWKRQSWTLLQVWHHLHLLAMFHLTHSRISPACFPARAHCRLMFKLMFPRTLRSFAPKLLGVSQHNFVPRVVPSQVQDLSL